MAKTTTITLTDDLDGTEATDSVTFGFRGSEYEIDLNTKNAAALEKALSKYLAAARKVGRGPATKRTAGRRPSRPSGQEDVAPLREWAKANGYKVGDRGRISAEVRDAYHAANG